MPDSQHNISSPLRERSFLVIAILYYIEHHLWHSLGLNISSSEPMTALNQLNLHGSPSAQRAIALSRQRRKVEEHLLACSISGDHANTCIQIEPAHHSVCDWQTVSTHGWSTSSPFLLRNANLPHFRCGVRFILVISTAFHDGTQVMSQFLVGRTTHKVPPVIDLDDVQIRAQDKGVRLRAIGVLPLRLIKNVDLFDEGPLLIGQERPLCSQPSTKGRLHERRVCAHRHQLAEIHGQFVLKLDQLPHLLLVTWAEEPAIEDQDQRIAVQKPQVCVQETGSREL